MLAAIAILLISASAGYLVLAKAVEKSGWIKWLGLVLGLAAIVLSVVGIAAIPSQMKKMQGMQGMLPGMERSPMSGQFRMPAPPVGFPPPGATGEKAAFPTRPPMFDLPDRSSSEPPGLPPMQGRPTPEPPEPKKE
ncbi:MAG: hypothetical protein NC910_04375 [Candidatus Omnitrophica bacterium]|nr:hypothetical protein [Candidatus Omnitrophota bacterium]